jgi:hypothetical protein
MDDPERITYFAQTDFRNKRANFGIKAKDRTRHIYVIGKTGMGKSTMLENMAAQDIMNGEGLAVMDPHGSMAEKLLEYVPEHRINDVVYFAPFDADYPVSFNVLEDVGIDKRHLVASGLMSSFKKIWVDAWSARMEYILNNILLALLEYPDSTLLGVNRMLSDKDYRKVVVDNIKDPSVKSFWVDEFAKYGDRYMQEAGAAIQNKIGQFTANPIIRNIIGQPKSSFDIREMMDNKKILIINLSKGRIGEANANLLGGMLITKIYLGAMSRADVSSEGMKRLPPFFLYVDEFQSFSSDSFADILSEARKYHLSLTVAHQYVEQMSEAVRAAILGNVGTMIIFRVGAVDAEIFEKEFAPQFTAEDIVNLGVFQVYMRLMIDGVGSKPFSAISMAPIPIPHRSFRDEILDASRKTKAQTRVSVETDIFKWHEPIKIEKKERIIPEGEGAPTSSFGPRPAAGTGGNSPGAAKPFQQAFSPRPAGAGTFAPRPAAPAMQADRPRPAYANRPAAPQAASPMPPQSVRQSPPSVSPSISSPQPARPQFTQQQAQPPQSQSQQSQQTRPRPAAPVQRTAQQQDERKPIAEREYVEPVRPKESLQTLLNKLSIEPERPKIIVDQAPETMPLSSLKKSKAPDPQKVADLRALLQKIAPAQPTAKPAAQPVAQQPAPTEKAAPTPAVSQATQQSALPNNAPLPKKEEAIPKEVPEDVLRSILSS